MRRFIAYLLIGFVLLFLQTSVLPRILPAALRPDLFIILIVYLSLAETFLRGSFIAWLAGCFKDVFAGSVLGFHGIVLLISFLIIKGTERRLNTESSLLLIILVFFGTVLERTLMAATLLIFADAGPAWQLPLRQLPVQMALTPLVAISILLIVRWLRRYTLGRLVIPELRYLDNRYEP